MNRHLVLVLRRRLPVLVLLPLVGVIIGVLMAPGGSATGPPAFTATALIAADQGAATETEVQQALVQAVEGRVAATVARQMGLTADEVSSRVDATLDAESFVISIVGSGPSRTAAEDLTGRFGRSFVYLGNLGAGESEAAKVDRAEADRDSARDELDEFRAENEGALAVADPPAELTDELTALENELAAAEAQLAEVMSSLRPTGRYELISVSDAGPAASSKLDLVSRPLSRAVLGGLLGLLAAVVVVALAERANPRVDDPVQAQDLVGAPVLALVPLLGRRRRDLLRRVDPTTFRGPFAEAFRTLRTTIDFRSGATEDRAPARVMITSATPGEGKSTTTAFLAAAYAAAGHPPVVIGSDLRRPYVHRLFGVERTPGLSTRAEGGERRPALHEMLRTDPLTGIAVMPSGPGLEEVHPVLDDIVEVANAGRDMGRTVLLDTAPVRVANDAVDLLPAVDCVVVVVRIGRSTVRSVAQMMQTLTINEAKVLGVVVLGSVESSDSVKYYSSYYSDDGSSGRGWRRPRADVDLSDPPVQGDEREAALTSSAPG